MDNLRVIISGGGTGGHIFPAIAIANEIKHRFPDAGILFVGTNKRMEMERVPKAGYDIKGIDIVGFDRKRLWKNISLPFKLWRGLRITRGIIKEFNPHVVIGVGGYASAPTLYSAQRLGIPTLIQEQNSFPGMTNRSLAKKADIICTAYDGMEKFFPGNKIVKTGNPIRQDISNIAAKRDEAVAFYGLNPALPTLLVVGGSLGAGSVNNGMRRWLDTFLEKGYQVIWQTGKYYYEEMKPCGEGKTNVKILPFLEKMDLAYAAADMVVSRAGAIAISELCVVGKPVILVPSPNVTEDHQTKNATALSSRDAAVLLPDNRVTEDLGREVCELFEKEDRRKLLAANMVRMGTSTAAGDIVDQVVSLLNFS